MPEPWRLPRTTPLAAAAALVVWACGDAGAGATWAGTVDTLPSGVIVARNPATPVLDIAHGWRLEETLRIGALEGDGPDVFSDVRDVAVGERGRIYVLQRQAASVHVFDSAGRFLYAAGRAGEGPGELRAPTGIALDPEGRLWVADVGRRLFLAYDSAGAPLEQHRRKVGSYRGVWGGRFLADGRLVEPFAAVWRSDGVGGHAVLRFDSTFAARDTLLFRPDPPDEDEGTFVFRDGRARAAINVAIPFHPTPTADIAPNGDLWSGEGADYRLVQRRLDGDTLRIVTREYEPVPVVDEDLADFRERVKRYGTPDESRIPKVKPAVSDVTVAADGTLWVRLHRPYGETGAVFDVFDRDGRYLTQVRAPVDLALHPPPVIRDGALYGVARTELDVPQVVRLRIVRP
ncbi:MAG TPA: 6-bladed beta-propeller [Gemmatimonadaceae bacterium]|nr:6-bladed beta-propeller [Gemmatimonadaceae bacterium]